MQNSLMPPEDAQQLSILSICHYIMAGIMLLPVFCCTAWIAITGVIFANTPNPSLASQNSAFQTGHTLGATMVFCCLGTVPLCLIILAVCAVIAGKRLSDHKSATFCTTVAYLLCLLIPLGTALGVFTLIVLARPAVKAEFEANDSVP
jgi:biotin transporter BioY